MTKKQSIGRSNAPLTASALTLVLATMAASQVAMAGVAAPEDGRSSRVDTVATDIGGGQRDYDYTVVNTSGGGDFYGGDFFEGPRVSGNAFIVDWELPYYVDAGITNIQTPFNWSYRIETVGQANPSSGWGGIAAWQIPGDPFNDFLNDRDASGNPIENGLTDAQEDAFLNVTEVLHWFIEPDFYSDSGCDGTVSGNGTGACSWGWDGGEGFFEPPLGAIAPGDELGGFGFDAAAAADIPAPYQASWWLQPVRTGDPPFPGSGNPAGPGIPLSPSLAGSTASVPEPGTLGLLSLGLGGLFWGSRRRRSRRRSVHVASSMTTRDQFNASSLHLAQPRFASPRTGVFNSGNKLT